jgi:transposase
MEDALLYEVFGVDRAYRSIGSTVVENGSVEVKLELKEPYFECPHCQSKDVIRKGKRHRRIQSLPIGFNPVRFQVEVPRCQCRKCLKIFEISPLFAPPTRATATR